MDNGTKKEQLLQELNRITGLELVLAGAREMQNAEGTDGQAANDEGIIERLTLLLDAYRRTGTREDAMIRWITGSVSAEDFRVLADRFHLDPEMPLVLYYIELDKAVDDVQQATRVLKQMLADRKGLMILRLHETAACILEPAKKLVNAKTAPEDPVRQTAESILSVLNTELFLNARIACSGIIRNVFGLPEAYGDAVRAMQIGRIFQPDRRIDMADDIGENRLMYELSPEVLKAYLAETLGEAFSAETGELTETAARVFESDYLTAANCFLENDLNIAETSRALHYHRNTLIYRIEQIHNAAGLDIRRFEDAMRYRLCAIALCALHQG